MIFAPDSLVNFIAREEVSTFLDEYKEEVKRYGFERYNKAFAT